MNIFHTQHSYTNWRFQEIKSYFVKRFRGWGSNLSVSFARCQVFYPGQVFKNSQRAKNHENESTIHFYALSFRQIVEKTDIKNGRIIRRSPRVRWEETLNRKARFPSPWHPSTVGFPWNGEMARKVGGMDAFPRIF